MKKKTKIIFFSESYTRKNLLFFLWSLRSLKGNKVNNEMEWKMKNEVSNEMGTKNKQMKIIKKNLLFSFEIIPEV